MVWAIVIGGFLLVYRYKHTDTFTRVYSIFFFGFVINCMDIDHGNTVHGSQFPATTDPLQVTVKLWLPQPPTLGGSVVVGKRFCNLLP